MMIDAKPFRDPWMDEALTRFDVFGSCESQNICRVESRIRIWHISRAAGAFHCSKLLPGGNTVIGN